MTATATQQNNRFNEEKQSLCTCVFNFGKFLEMTKFKVSEFFILLLKLSATPTNFVPGYFAVSVEVERVEIIAK